MGTVSNERDERPWGSYEVLDDTSTHKVKRLEVHPGCRLSYQRHSRRAEHWFVTAGTADVTIDGVRHVVTAGQAIDIPRGAAHRIGNAGTEPLVFVEVQHGDYFGEDDIERLEDDYGRVGA
jgi:mannose-6-phosphate isomerase